MKEIKAILSAYRDYRQQNTALALASVVGVEGSSYRRIGARMLVAADGTWTGGISGGCLEGDALKKAHLAINRKTPSTVIYDTTEEDSEEIGVGLGCNGKIEVLFQPLSTDSGQREMSLLEEYYPSRTPKIIFKVIEAAPDSRFHLGQIIEEHDVDDEGFGKKLEEARAKQRTLHWKGAKETVLIEVIRPNIRLIIFGDNYDIYPLANAAGELGWDIELYGLLRKIRKLFAFDIDLQPREKLADANIDGYTAVVLMSHDFNADKKVIPLFIDEPPSYLGMLGPRKRWDRMVDELREEGNMLPDSFVQHVHNPIGLDIGAEVPEEISTAICAEIIATFRQRDAGFLKYRPGPIH